MATGSIDLNCSTRWSERLSFRRYPTDHTGSMGARLGNARIREPNTFAQFNTCTCTCTCTYTFRAAVPALQFINMGQHTGRYSLDPYAYTGSFPSTFSSTGGTGSHTWAIYATLTPGESSDPPPAPTPTPTPRPTPPPQAVTAGFTSLNFDQEPGQTWDIGYGTDGHKWNAGMWWYAVPPTSDFAVNNGC